MSIALELVVLILFLMLAVVISSVTVKLRRYAKEAQQREAQVSMLYQLSKDLAAADSFDDVLNVIRVNVGKILDCHVAIYLYGEKKLEIKVNDPDLFLAEKDNAAAKWSYTQDAQAGHGTEVYRDARCKFIPLKTSQGIFGVLGVCYKGKVSEHESKNNHILSALANQAAIAIHRTKLAEVSRQLDLMRETEKLQTALLNSISHDLRTPLVSIMGVLENLLHDFSSLDQQTRKELLANAYEDADHLNRLVTNLLDMTRLEAKALKIRVELCDLRDVIGASLQPLKDEIDGRDIHIHIPENLPEISIDFTLMMRVFINLVDNAVKYSRPGTPITITATLEKEAVRIEVADGGIGIPTDDLKKVFDKFYRAVSPKQITGTGLGLSICKGIVEVHGGQIDARNNVSAGVTVSVLLPLASQGALAR